MANNKNDRKVDVEVRVERSRIVEHSVALHGPPNPIATKLVGDQQSKAERNQDIGVDSIKPIVDGAMRDVHDIRLIIENLPELDTARDILVSSILAPNNMVQEEVSVAYEGDIPASLSSAMLNTIREYFFETYKIQEELPEILGNALMNKGSHILAVLPESSIDDIINQRETASLESFKQVLEGSVDLKQESFSSLGIFGEGLRRPVVKRPVKHLTAFEAMYSPESTIQSNRNYDVIDGLVRIVDNIDLLKFPEVAEILRERTLSDRYRKSASSYAYFGDEEGNDNLTIEVEMEHTQPEKEALRFDRGKAHREERPFNPNQLVMKPKPRYDSNISVVGDRHSTTRSSVGHPLVLSLPHESCVPVFSPGNPKDHLGYLILVDKMGHPLTVDSIAKSIDEMEIMGSGAESLKKNANFTAITTTLTQMNHYTNTHNNTDLVGIDSIEKLNKFYASMVEKDLMTRLRNGVYGENATIGNQQELYRIMLARSLSGQMTQIMYLPASLVTYFAYNTNSLGMGVSLIARTKTLAALRIALMYAINRSMIRNAVGNNVIRITLDEDDPDPQETITTQLTNVIERNSFGSLFSTFDPRKIQGELTRAGYTLVVEGNSGFEQTTTEISSQSADRVVVDSEYVDTLRKQHLASILIVPDLLDSASEAQFAAEVTRDNVLFNNQMRQYRTQTEQFIRDFMVKSTLHDGELVKTLSEMIRKEYKVLSGKVVEKAKQAKSTMPIIEHFLNDIVVTLPTADDINTEALVKTYEAYKSYVETILETAIGDDIIESLYGDIEDNEKRADAIKNTRAIMTSYFIEKWRKSNGVFQEWDDLLAQSTENKKQLVESILSNPIQTAELMSGVVLGLQRKLNPKAFEDDEEGEGGDDMDSSSSDETDDSDPFDESSGTDTEVEGEENGGGEGGVGSDIDIDNIDAEIAKASGEDDAEEESDASAEDGANSDDEEASGTDKDAVEEEEEEEEDDQKDKDKDLENL